PAVVDEEHLGVGRELVQHLATGAARRRRLVRLGVDEDLIEPAAPGRDQRLHRRLLGAAREAVAGVLDVRAGVHRAVRGPQRGAHAEARVRDVGVRERALRRHQEVRRHARARGPGALAAHAAPAHRPRRPSRGGPRTTTPTRAAPIAAVRTEAAARSFAAPANGWWCGIARSTAASTALFISSSAITSAQASRIGAAGALSQAARPTAATPIPTSMRRFGCLAQARASPWPATAND